MWPNEQAKALISERCRLAIDVKKSGLGTSIHRTPVMHAKGSTQVNMMCRENADV